jgi:predicted Mrr-cat superfamily restriction endonuclease
MAFWIVRSGKNGEQGLTAIKNKLVAIGCNELPDISDISNKPALRKLWQKAYYPQHKKAKAANQMEQVWSFLHEIKIGDLV